jgi:hypothetical protein
MLFNWRKIIFVLLILNFSNSFSFEKVGTTSFQFLKVITTARAASLAGAYTTIANTADAAFWNPAGLTEVQTFNASFGYLDWFMDVAHMSFSAAYSFESIGTFALFGMVADIGDIEETQVGSLGFDADGNYNPGLTGNVLNPRSFVVGLSYAYDLNDRFSFGLTVKYAHEDLALESAGGVMFDGGIKYKTDFRSIVIGATLRHFGQDIQFVDNSYPLPQTFNIGISTYLFSNVDPLITDLGTNSLLFSYDLVQPRDYDQQHAIALEYGFNEMIYLRGGYIFNGDQEDFTAGLGLRYNEYRVDYAYNEMGEYFGTAHRFTISFGIN